MISEEQRKSEILFEKSKDAAIVKSIDQQRLDIQKKSIQDKRSEQIEDLVNQKIQEDLEVKKEEMSLDEALKSGALAFFKEKYPEKVTVYTIGDFSKEICAGPHVKRTSELGKFKILKEESAGAGIRRIKAKVE